MKIEISSFSGNLDIESLDWVYEVEKFFDMAYVPRRNMSSSWHIRSRKEEPHGGTNYKSQGDGNANHKIEKGGGYNGEELSDFVKFLRFKHKIQVCTHPCLFIKIFERI